LTKSSKWSRTFPSETAQKYTGSPFFQDQLYFAYGSNLNSEDVRGYGRRHGITNLRLDPVCVAYLPDMELAFNHTAFSRGGGALNIRPCVGQVVQGVVFRPTADQWAVLNSKEGCPSTYRKVAFHVLTLDGHSISITTFVLDEKRYEGHFIPPATDYKQILYDGYKVHGLDTSILDAVTNGEKPTLFCDAIFAYGTLMRCEKRHALLTGCGKIECSLLAVAPGRLFDCGEYPAMMPATADGDFVRGEFIRLSADDMPAVLKAMDRIEGFRGHAESDASLFHRRLIESDVGDERIRRAWVFILASPPPDAPSIISGDWREHRGTRDRFVDRLIAAHCPEGTMKIVNALASRIPWSLSSDRQAVIENLIDLSAAVKSGELSERRLAQESGRWAVTIGGDG